MVSGQMPEETMTSAEEMVLGRMMTSEGWMVLGRMMTSEGKMVLGLLPEHTMTSEGWMVLHALNLRVLTMAFDSTPLISMMVPANVLE